MRPQLVGIAQVIPGLEQDDLGVVARNPLHADLASLVVSAQRRQLFRQQRRELAAPLATGPHHLVIVEFPYMAVVANDLALGAVEAFQLLVFAVRLDHMSDARSLHPVAVLIDEHAAIVGLVARKRQGLEPVQADLAPFRAGVAGEQQQAENCDAPLHRHLASGL